MRPRSLRGRLALLALAGAAAWVLLLIVVFNVFLSARMRGEADSLLRARAAAAASTVRVLPGGTVTVTEPADDEALDSDIWIYQGRLAVERPRASRLLQQHADGFTDAGRGFARRYGARWYARPITSGGHRVGTIVTAVNLRPYQATTTSALAGSIALAVLLLAGMYLVTRAVVGRALRPVAQMSRQAAEWSGQDLGRRFGSGRRPTELAALAARFDELLERLSLVLRHEQQWSAELSHELRTPLSRIIAEADWLRERPRAAGDQEAGLKVIWTAAEEMRQICDTLLAEARNRGTGLPGRCLLSALTGELAARWPEDTARLRVVPPQTDLVAGASPEILERILAPLLDNARRYASTTVTVRCEPGVRIGVSDDGPGVASAIRDRLFEPGFRADPGDGHQGAGLGLALARRLARSAGGDLIFDGKTGFVVTLPPG